MSLFLSSSFEVNHGFLKKKWEARPKRSHTVCFYLYEISRIRRPAGTESTLAVARAEVRADGYMSLVP